MNIVARLLRKNTSGARVAGFILSNFIGLAIILGALQFYIDARSIWEEKGSFVSTDYLVLNKKVTESTLWGEGSGGFSPAEISDLRSQPWVREVGEFKASDFKVLASLSQGGRGFSTYMFFESIPGEFVDVDKSKWEFNERSGVVPIIISKDYLALYNFGFAGTAGLPQLSENLMSGIPLRLTLTSEDGGKSMEFMGRVAGYSNRLNTILVPEEFMNYANSRLGSGEQKNPSRLIVDVSSPGDVAIAPYLEEHNLESAGDKSASSAAFMLKLVVGIVIAIGGVITLLSFFILMLSISLIMEKNRDKLHSLLMLGYNLGDVASPYRRLVVVSSVVAGVLAICSALLMRHWYAEPLSGLGAREGFPWLAPLTGVVLTLLIVIFNIVAVNRKVKASWR